MRLHSGDIVLTYNGCIAQVREIERENTGVKLNTGEWVENYELVPVRRLGYKANGVMRERGRSRL